MLRVQEALNSLDAIDREVLALRHFEQFSRAEAAQVLGITQEAGAKRYFRALKRLKDVLATLPGGWEGLMVTMSTSGSRDYGRFDELAEEFAQRFRRGERPNFQEYIDRCPRWPTRSARCSRLWWRSSGPRATRAAKRRRDPRPCRASARWATIGSSARSAAAAWGWSTRPSRSRWAVGWP